MFTYVLTVDVKQHLTWCEQTVRSSCSAKLGQGLQIKTDKGGRIRDNLQTRRKKKKKKKKKSQQEKTNKKTIDNEPAQMPRCCCIWMADGGGCGRKESGLLLSFNT